jgi:hypothetical protein
MQKLKLILPVMALSLALCLLFLSQAPAYELSGYIEAEGRAFFNDALFHGQERDSASLAIQPEFYHEWGKGSNLTFTPFARIDSADPERSHFDIRELNYLLFNDKWELRIGISKVFWGVTEFVHLIDIINQTDLVEDMDGEDKLGQPMILFSAPRNWGTVNIFILPYFRERTFPGEKGRFRSEFAVDTDNAVYENSAKEHHIDLAVRYSHTIGDWDFGIYHFNGTGREPIIYLDTDADGNPGLVPFYEQIDQTGLDVQAVKGSWLIKLESLYRTGQGEGFFAGVGGIEYSFVNIASSRMDLGLIGEWAYDERGDEATTMFDNDIMAGARLAFNDAASTEALIGLIQDLNSEGTVLSLESGRRIGNSWKINLDSFFVLDSSEEDAVHSLRNDDSVQLEIAYFF